MSTSPDLGIPFVSSQQAQPEITHNEAIVMMSATLKGALQIGLNTPPGSPTAGDVYVIGPAPTGAWSGRANVLTAYVDGGWRFLPDRNSAGTIITMGARHEGLRVWDNSTNGMYVWDGAAWVGFASTPPLPAEYGGRSIINNTTVKAVTAAVDATLATNSDYSQVTGIFVPAPEGQLNGITQQTNTFTINRSGVYRVEFWANAKASVNNTQIAFKFGVNGVIAAARRPMIFMRNNTEVHNGSGFNNVHFNAGDVISLWIASTNTANITIEDAVFQATSVKFD